MSDVRIGGLFTTSGFHPVWTMTTRKPTAGCSSGGLEAVPMENCHPFAHLVEAANSR